MAWVKGIAPKLMHDKLGIYHGQWMPEMDRCWMDYERGYSVCSRLIRTKFGKVEHVTITRIHDRDNGVKLYTGGEAAIGWSEKMMIKNELFGEDRFAIEVYPKQDRLVDVTDTYHLWVFDKKLNMPFGIHPKEHIKAINRGAGMNEAEFEELSDHFHDLRSIAESENMPMIVAHQQD